MEIYLNVAEWGSGVYGAEAAAEHYFGVPASKLTARQAALLAAVLPSPSAARRRQSRARGYARIARRIAARAAALGAGRRLRPEIGATAGQTAAKALYAGPNGPPPAAVPGAAAHIFPLEHEMPVPKRKTSRMKRGFRRSHDALAKPTYVEDKESGELRRPHHIDLKSGKYRGREVLAPKE